MELETRNRPATEVVAPTHRGDRLDVFEPGQASLLVFVPAAFTPVCGNEIRELAELATIAEHRDVRLLVASCDTAATLRAWLAEIDPAGALIALSDHWPHGALARMFGAFDDAAGLATRRSYAISAQGDWALVAASPAGIARSQRDHRHGVDLAAAGFAEGAAAQH